MVKKGQVTVFIIFGIVIVSIVGLYFAARQVGIGIDPQDFVISKTGPIEKQVDECILQGADVSLDVLGRQGGDLNPVIYKRYKDEKITYLGYNKNGEPNCINRMLTKEDMESDLNEFLKDQLYQCIDLSGFATLGVDVLVGDLNVNTTIVEDKVLVNVYYPITLRKGETELTISDFEQDVEAPLGELHAVAKDIIEMEAEFGTFDTLSYSLRNNGRYMIKKIQPYPDKIYIVKIDDHPYIFQFAIQGEKTR